MINFYNYVLTELNKNQHDVVFDGNVFFYYHAHNNDFVLYSVDEEELKIDKIEYVPFVENSSDEITFVDDNGRTDFHKLYVIPIKVEDNVQFDLTSKPYQALVDFKNEYNGKIVSFEGFRYAFKVSEPRPEGVPILKRGSGWYRLFTVSIAFTRLESGTFGNDISVTLATDDNGTVLSNSLDFINFTPASASDTQVERDISVFSNNFSVPIARMTEFDITFNYTDSALERKLLDFAFGNDGDDIDNEYTLSIALPHKTYTKTVVLTQAAATFEKGVVVSALIKLVEKEE